MIFMKKVLFHLLFQYIFVHCEKSFDMIFGRFFILSIRRF